MSGGQDKQPDTSHQEPAMNGDRKSAGTSGRSHMTGGCPFSAGAERRVTSSSSATSSPRLPARKISNISVASSQGLGDEEEEEDERDAKRLHLKAIVDAVTSLILPAVSR